MFVDHYLDVEYDLSQSSSSPPAKPVMHTIPPALTDRMRYCACMVIPSRKKVEIAKQFLVKKQMLQAGLPKEREVHGRCDPSLIRSYTREAGVRNLEREIETSAAKSPAR